MKTGSKHLSDKVRGKMGRRETRRTDVLPVGPREAVYLCGAGGGRGSPWGYLLCLGCRFPTDGRMEIGAAGGAPSRASVVPHQAQGQVLSLSTDTSHALWRLTPGRRAFPPLGQRTDLPRGTSHFKRDFTGRL